MLVYVSTGLAEMFGHAGEPADREIEGRLFCCLFDYPPPFTVDETFDDYLIIDSPVIICPNKVTVVTVSSVGVE
jgi:hypothetical protein